MAIPINENVVCLNSIIEDRFVGMVISQFETLKKDIYEGGQENVLSPAAQAHPIAIWITN